MSSQRSSYGCRSSREFPDLMTNGILPGFMQDAMCEDHALLRFTPPQSSARKAFDALL